MLDGRGTITIGGLIQTCLMIKHSLKNAQFLLRSMWLSMTGDVLDTILWEAFKVVIKGFVISYEATQKSKKKSTNQK